MAALLFNLSCGRKQDYNFLVLHNCKIYTMDEEKPSAEVAVFQGGRIVYVGDSLGCRSYINRGGECIDLKGAVVLPGLIDAHAHMQSLGKLMEEINLRGVESTAEARRLVMEAADTIPPGQWISGRGWDQNLWQGKQFPTWRDLMGTESHPVYLRRVDGHAAWVNRTALDICAISRETPDPEGGLIIRGQSGEPTGVLLDEAIDLVSDSIPDPPPELRRQRFIRAMEECSRYGLTGIGDAGLKRDNLTVWRDLAAEGLLSVRIYAMLLDDEPGLLEEYYRSGPQIGLGGGMLTIRAVKLFADGALGSRGALMMKPYSDQPSSRGIAVTSPEKIRAKTAQALKNGFQVCTHAIGDGANRNVLNAYRLALKEVPSSEHRLRIEHAQILAKEDILKFAELGIIASMQPTHATSDMGWAEDRVGAERIKGAYAWRDLMNAGVKTAFGSDFPVEEVNPFLGIQAAVTRCDIRGQPEGGWYPEQRLTVYEAVRGFTAGAAYAQFQENLVGKIKPGMRADFTIIDRDIFEIPPAEIHQTQALMTIVNGKIVYQAGE